MNNSITSNDNFNHYKGEIELEYRDKHGNVVLRHIEPNLIKIFAKEMLSHRLPYSRVWDPNANAGAGEWINSGIDQYEEFAAKYILIGASFDEDTDARYYNIDPVTGGSIAKTPNVGADNFGDLINPVPISEPNRPLKRIQNIYFEPTYQPPDSPLLQDNVRAMNNVLVLETILEPDEYNGFGTTDSDFFTITEIALAGGRAMETDMGTCECPPKILFLEGVDGQNDQQIIATANGSQTISIESSVDANDVNRIVQGDQIMLVERAGSAEEYGTLGQVTPYYLVVNKSTGGRDIVLDRTPVDSDGNPLTGPIGIYRSTLRLFSQRILSMPFMKSSDFSIVIRWRINFN